MKKIRLSTTCLLLFITAALWAQQVPVMNPIQGPDTICMGSSGSTGWITYSASAGNSPKQFYWQPVTGANLSSYSGSVISVNFLGSGNYILSCYAANSAGNSSMVYKIVTVVETPSVTFSGGDYAQFCQGSSTTFMASNTTNSGSSTLQYLWTPSYGLSSTNTWSTTANPSVSTIYTLQVSLMNCSSFAQVTVNVLPLPVINVTSNNNPMCTGEKAVITISGTGITYSVNGVASPLSFTVAPTTTVNYVVSAVSADGCEDQMTFAQNVSLCMAVQKLKEDLSSFLVYPNPSAGDTRLKAGHDLQVSVFNQLGALIRKLDLTAGEETPLRDLDPGVYLLTGEGKTTRLIITR